MFYCYRLAESFVNEELSEAFFDGMETEEKEINKLILSSAVESPSRPLEVYVQLKNTSKDSFKEEKSLEINKHKQQDTMKDKLNSKKEEEGEEDEDKIKQKTQKQIIKKKLMSIYGFGKFATNNLLQLLGFFDVEAFDSETIRYK